MNYRPAGGNTGGGPRLQRRRTDPYFNAMKELADISGSEHAEETLRRSEANLRDFLENASEGIRCVGPYGRILWTNQAELDLLGYTREEYIGHHIAEFFADAPVIEDILARLTRGETLRGREARMVCKDGSIRHVLINSNALLEDGKFVHTRCFTRDITERKRAEKAIRAAYEQASAARAEAEAANRNKDEFLATVSHELRSPVNAILGYNRMLRENPLDADQVNQCCDIIERNARAQLQLIEDLLDTARIVSGKLRLELRPLEIVPVLADALDVARPAAEAKGVRLWIVDCGLRIEDDASQEESAIPESQPAIVLGDAARLQQIVWNLLLNAIKFTPAGGRVELRAERAKERIRIIVSDTGEGIQPEFLLYIFDRFRQADSSSSQRSGGLGLGLALVKHLAELHGGAVEAASEGAGCGATFTVTLPLATQTELGATEPLPTAAGVTGEAQAKGAIPAPAGLKIAGVRVLVVNDQEESRVSLADFLNRCDAIVTTASSGAEVLAILSNPPGGARPDILIYDIAMPEGDGYAALRLVRALEAANGVEASQRIPAIALAGKEERLRALSAGFQGHIAKPVEPVELMLVIANIVGLPWLSLKTIPHS